MRIDQLQQLKGINSPITYMSVKRNIKWDGFQLAKVNNGRVEWIESTDLKKFGEKAVKPPSQKQKPVYLGRFFEKIMTYVTPTGEIFIGGQEYRKILSRERTTTSEGLINYEDLLLFYFDVEGKLKAQYGACRDEMNRESKSMLTPQELILSPDGNAIYWIYGEIGGFKKNGIFSDDWSKFSEAKLLYYPAVAKIDLGRGQMGDFTIIGQNDTGEQVYFSHPDFSHVLSEDGKQLLFLGENKSGNQIWLGQMNLWSK
ncbi:MAG: hypothetical protein AAF849_24475 [Bacteroidota bacterium]